MGLPTEMLRALIATGASPETILALSEAAEAREQAQREAEEAREEAKRAAKREATAARVRKHREAKRNAGNALHGEQSVTGVTKDAGERDHVHAEEITSKPNTTLDTKTSEPKGSSGKKPKASKPRTPISEDAQPSERQRRDASERGLSAADFRHQWQRFRDHHLKHGNLFSNWEAAWRTWLDSPIREREAAATAQARASPNGRPKSAQQAAFDAARQAHLELMEDDHGQGPFDGDAPAHAAGGGYQNGHARSDFHEPLGGRLRLAPPRLAGPPRPH